jgi:HEAT repeats
VVFSAYRLKLVRAGKYGAFKGFFQIGAALLFFTLLLPSARNRYEEQKEGLQALLQDSNPEVRALAAEVARHRPEGKGYVGALVRCLRDPDTGVRQECHRSLVALTGQDLGPPADPAALRAWEARYP